MKKTLLTMFSVLFVAVAAQAQIGYGVKAGVNLSKVSGKNINSDNLTSFNFTGYMDAPIAPNLSIQPGISLQGKGGKSSFLEDNLNVENKTDLMYLEIPVNFVYYVDAGMGDIFVGAGPYAGFGLSGKTKVGNVKTDIEWGGDNGMKRFDYGANFLVGYKFDNGFLVSGGYGLGLGNMMPKSVDSNMKQHNRTFSIGVGFQL